jgi:hypothetical protein
LQLEIGKEYALPFQLMLPGAKYFARNFAVRAQRRSCRRKSQLTDTWPIP